jgi:hypothetical protein
MSTGREVAQAEIVAHRVSPSPKEEEAVARCQRRVVQADVYDAFQGEDVLSRRSCSRRRRMLSQMPSCVEEREEEVGKKAVGARSETRRIVDDGTPPWSAHAGAADYSAVDPRRRRTSRCRSQGSDIANVSACITYV